MVYAINITQHTFNAKRYLKEIKEKKLLSNSPCDGIYMLYAEGNMDKAIIKEKKILDKGMNKLVKMDKKRDKACDKAMKKGKK